MRRTTADRRARAGAARAGAGARRRGGRALQPGAPVQAGGEDLEPRSRECEKAITLRPDYAAAHLTLGNLYRAQGDYARAAGEFEKTVKLQPKDADAHANLGAAYVAAQAVRRGDPRARDGARAQARRLRGPAVARVRLQAEGGLQARHRAPAEGDRAQARRDPQAWTNLGVAKSKTDDKDGAIVALKKAIALKPDDAELHFDLAVVYRRQRNTDEAIAEYQVAVQKNPKFAKAYYDLGILYSQEKKNRRGAGGLREVPRVRRATRTPPRARTPRIASRRSRARGRTPPPARPRRRSNARPPTAPNVLERPRPPIAATSRALASGPRGIHGCGSNPRDASARSFFRRVVCRLKLLQTTRRKSLVRRRAEARASPSIPHVADARGRSRRGRSRAVRRRSSRSGPIEARSWEVVRAESRGAPR